MKQPSRALRLRAFVGVIAAIAALVPGAFFSPAAAADPQQVNFTLEGCRNNGDITLPNGSGKFICPDSAYTTGNLGKGWNELDLVPYRITADAGNAAPATQTYTVAIVVDNKDAGHPGYDFLSVPELNTALSDSSCTAPVVGPEQILSPGLGGIDESRYRLVTITQDQNTTCVYDYYARLALGSHLFPGSSLHANLANEELGTAGIGSKDVSIPVKEISPQELRKDMTATQDSDHAWDITKGPTPATVSFANTCDTGSPRSAQVQIKVTWHKQDAIPFGLIHVVTHVYAKNPASRVITVQGTDDIRSGTTVLDTASFGPTDIPANTELLVLTHTVDVPDGTTDLNDVATATYTDKVTGIPVPGNTQATASATVQPSGITLNDTAIINDVESISGTGFSYSVDSFSGASGAFDGGYVAGTETTGSVSWTSDTQSGDGSVTFDKTVYVAAATSSNGTLSDTATLNGSDGFTAQATASVDLSSSAFVDLTINKTIPNILQGSETATFSFKVKDSGNNVVATPSVTFTAGQTSKSVTVNDLAPGTYTVSEDPATGWDPQADHVVTINLPSCSGSTTFDNTFRPAKARVQKITVPAGSSTGWQFTLNGPGTPVGGETVSATAGAGYVNFATVLEEGSYSITEIDGPPGYDQTGFSGDCFFSVDYIADAGRVFSCTYTNTQRGQIIVKKFTDPAGSSQSFEFDPSYFPNNYFLTDGQEFGSGDLQPGTYSVAEVNIPTGWDLTSATCDDGSAPSSIGLAAGETVTCTFRDRQRGHIIVRKVTKPASSTQSFEFDTSYGANFFLQNGQSNDSGPLVPGSYSVAEINIPADWDLTSATCNDGSAPSNIGLAAGETVTCTFHDRQRGLARVIKTVDGAPPSGTQSFTFQLRQGASTTSAGTILEQGVANAANGGIINFTTLLVPGATYNLCEIVLPGWSNNLGNQYVVYNPLGDNSTLCTDFRVRPGQTKVFRVDNSPPPGGLARTIGFWRNWASCSSSSGKQKPVLDQTLALAEPTGVQIGDLFLHGSTATPNQAPDCLKAVRILSKQTIDTGANRAKDPAFGLAAQLLAAKLNYLAGSIKCPAATTAINSAQALLDAINFNGITHDTMTTAQKSEARSLASTLDQYNNNELC